MGQRSDRSKTREPGRVAAMVAVGFSASIAVGALLVACAGSSVDVQGGPLSVTLTADPLAQSVGGDVLVRAEVVGTHLSGTVLDYGDGQVDSFPALGAITQTVTQVKRYDSAGTYTIVATAEDAGQGSKSGQVTIQVNP